MNATPKWAGKRWPEFWKIYDPSPNFMSPDGEMGLAQNSTPYSFDIELTCKARGAVHGALLIFR